MFPTVRDLILNLLIDKKLSSKEIADDLNLTQNRVLIAIKVAKENKQVYICGWRRNLNTRGDLTPIYAIGNKEHVLKPVKLNQTQLNKRVIAKAKKEKTWRKKHIDLRKNEIDNKIEQLKTKPNEWFVL